MNIRRSFFENFLDGGGGTRFENFLEAGGGGGTFPGTRLSFPSLTSWAMTLLFFAINAQRASPLSWLGPCRFFRKYGSKMWAKLVAGVKPLFDALSATSLLSTDVPM